MKRQFVGAFYRAAMSLAKETRDEVMLANPCAKVSKVKVLSRSAVGDIVYNGDAKAIKEVAPKMSFQARVDIE